MSVMRDWRRVRHFARAGIQRMLMSVDPVIHVPIGASASLAGFLPPQE